MSLEHTVNKLLNEEYLAIENITLAPLVESIPVIEQIYNMTSKKSVVASTASVVFVLGCFAGSIYQLFYGESGFALFLLAVSIVLLVETLGNLNATTRHAYVLKRHLFSKTLYVNTINNALQGDDLRNFYGEHYKSIK